MQANKKKNAIKPRFYKLEVGDSVKFPIERHNSVRHAAWDFCLTTGKKLECNTDRSKNIIRVTRTA